MSIEQTLRGLEFEYRRPATDPYRRVQIEGEIARLRAILAKRGR